MRHLAGAVLLGLVACSSDAPPTDVLREPMGDTLSPLETPDTDGGSLITYCNEIRTWCPAPQQAVYPLGPHEATWLGRPQQCYCSCVSHEDCSLSPDPSECGFVFDLVNGQKVQRFQYPMVCRYTEFKQAY